MNFFLEGGGWVECVVIFLPKSCHDIFTSSLDSFLLVSNIFNSLKSHCVLSIWPLGWRGWTPWWPRWFCQCSPGVCSWFPPVCGWPPSTRNRKKQKSVAIKGTTESHTSTWWTNNECVSQLLSYLSTRHRVDLSCQGVGEGGRHQVLGSLDAQVDNLSV